MLVQNSLNGILNKNKKSVISSVFPSTTTAAITTLSSGLAPIEHGWLGWTLYFKEINKYINIFPYVDFLTGEKIKEKDMRKLITYKSTFDMINEKEGYSSYVVHPSFIDSNFSNLYKYNNIKEMTKIVKELTQKEGKKFIYAYSASPDFEMHEYGTQSLEVNAAIYNIEEAIKDNLINLEDTLIIITADHGHVDIENYVYVLDDCKLISYLKIMPFIEGRAASFHILPGKEEEFKTYFLNKYNDDFLLLSKQEVISMKLFGPGKIHPKSLDFIGDYMAIAIGKKAFHFGKKDDKALISMHAGLTTDEIEVPLIILSSN